LLPTAGLVLRLGAPGERSLAKARRGVAVAQWLTRLGFPAVEPADVDQPVLLDTAVVTFWRYYPQHDRGYPPVTHLAALLRQLHQLTTPPADLPVELPTYQPLQSFTAVLAAARGLPDDDLDFLADTRQRLLTAYTDLAFVLPPGLIHADAWTGNLLWDGYPVLRDIHQLHTLTSFIRLAPTDPAAHAELRHRITCLRNGDQSTRWTPF
jgi:hypothetical protein